MKIADYRDYKQEDAPQCISEVCVHRLLDRSDGTARPFIDIPERVTGRPPKMAIVGILIE